METTNQLHPPYDISKFGLKPKFPEVLDSSMLQDFVDCPSQFYLKHVLGQRLKGAESAALDWGSRWHEVMYVLHHEWDLKAAMEEIDTNWPATLHEQDPKNRTQERMRAQLLEYHNKYARMDKREFRTIRREEFFHIHCGPDDPNCPFPWKGCDHEWIGRIDRIVERTSRKRILVWDYKTTSWLRHTFFDELRHGFQILGYIWAASHLIRGQVLTAYIDLLHTIKNDENFHRRELRFSEQEILEWLQNVKMYQAQMRLYESMIPDEPELWPKNWNHCDRFGGCPFKVIHHLAPIRDTRLRILEEDFVEDRWDPAALVED